HADGSGGTFRSPVSPLCMDALRQHLASVMDLRHAAAVLEWDQETHMPSGGAEGRAHQVATLRRVAHETFASDMTASLLDAAQPDTEADQALVRVTRRDLARATRLPGSLVGALAEATARAKIAWAEARPASDWPHFAPHLQQILDLTIQKADLLRPLLAEERGAGYAPEEADARYDALLDEYEPGAITTEVAGVFSDLRRDLVPLVEEVAQRGVVDAQPLHRYVPETIQWELGMEIAYAFGYDLERGRQDLSAHPFTTSFGADDVRITTRIDPNFFPTALYGTLHETGHALYEQGIGPDLARTPLADSTSLGIHESQSRLWENQVGRSRAFWRRHFGAFQAQIGSWADLNADAVWRTVNRVEPSLIRVEADEVTYHLHVLLRFTLERELVAGRLAVADVPEAWNAGMESLLGVTPIADKDGCLQDIHWSLGALGYFPTYTLGTLMSGQLWEAMRHELGDLDGIIRAGEYREILGWLRENVHRWGRAKTAEEILQDTAHSALDARPWLDYIRAKVDAVYG
ncbi:MAG: carboxypeptidase M32, partial [Bacteroidota bacterium]